MDYYVLSQVVNGVIFGLIYALIALGLTVVFSIMRVVNFSHGELYMLGGYTLYALTAGAVALFSIPLAIPTIVALPLAMAAVATFGVAVERGLLRPVYTARMDRPEEYAIILTFGLSLFLQYGALTAVGPYEMTPGSFWGGVEAHRRRPLPRRRPAVRRRGVRPAHRRHSVLRLRHLDRPRPHGHRAEPGRGDHRGGEPRCG